MLVCKKARKKPKIEKVQMNNFKEMHLTGYITAEQKGEIVAELRKLISHIETDSWPLLGSYRCERKEGVLTMFNICLSMPWGG